MHVDFPPALIELLQRQLSQFGRLGATRVYQAPSAGVLAAGATSNPTQIRFPEPGIALACYGQELAGTVANLAGTSVRVQIGGVEDLFVDGQGGGAYLPMLALFGSTQNWFPLNRTVKPEIPWAVSFRNATGGNVTPAFAVAFLSLASR